MWMASNLQYEGLKEAIKVIDGKRTNPNSVEQISPKEANKNWRRLLMNTRKMRNGNV